jgi:hypothetical protein
MVKASAFSKKYLLVFVLLCMASIQMSAQELKEDTLLVRYNKVGFENNTGVGFLFSEGHSALALSTVMGYRPNPYFFIGIGGALEFYGGTFLIPVFVDPRVNFIDGKTSPFLYFDVGYSFGQADSLNKMIQLGPRFNPGLGLKTKIQNEVCISISLGYVYQMAKFHKDLYLLDGSFTDRNNNDYHLFVVRFELIF